MSFHNGFPHSKAPSSLAFRLIGLFAIPYCVFSLSDWSWEAEQVAAIIPMGILSACSIWAWITFIKDKREDTMYQRKAKQKPIEEEKPPSINNAEKKDPEPVDVMTPEEALKRASAPSNCYVGPDKLPACMVGDEKWGAGYTFYTAGQRGVFHTKDCSLTKRYSLTPINAVNVQRGLPGYPNRIPYYPCTLCKPHLPDLGWYELYMFFISHSKHLFDTPPQVESERPIVRIHNRD